MWLKVGTFSSYLWSEGLVSIIKQVSIKLIQYRKCPFFLAYLRDVVKVVHVIIIIFADATSF